MKFFVVGYILMKKILLSVILIFFCNGLALSGEFDWTKTVTNESGESDYFLDHQSVRTIGNYNYQWILTNYLKDSQKVKSDVSYATIDCKKIECKWFFGLNIVIIMQKEKLKVTH